jgi:DnaJ-class molecular chaperone
LTAALEELGLPPEATRAEVEEAWRRLRRLHHPDHGGDAAAFDRAKKAYDEAAALLDAPRHCEACAGTGRVARGGGGFGALSMTCGACGGEGKIPPGGQTP